MDYFEFEDITLLAKYHLDYQVTLYRGDDFTLFVRRVGFDYVEITKASETQRSLPPMENDGFRITTFTLSPNMYSNSMSEVPFHITLAMKLLNPNSTSAGNLDIGLNEIMPFEPSNLDTRQRRVRDVVIRPDQSEFRRKLLQIYQKSCLVSKTKVSEVLQAAHILPYSGEYSNHIQNGLLLRNDIHTLYDDYLLSICPESFQILLNPKLEDSEYWKYNEKSVLEDIPTDIRLRPSLKALMIHYRFFKEELES